MELPRPNSGHFTFAEAEARKSEIFSLMPSGVTAGWKNPYMGFAVHITGADEVIVHGSTFDFTQGGRMTVPELKKFLAGYPRFGNPTGVLVTCERDPRLSPVFSQVIDVLFHPGVQIFYYKNG